jgi:cell division transport system ATP-binding protein
MPYISFKDVRVEYPGHVFGLNGVSLEINKGEFVFLIGSTGAGKSTLLKLLTHEAQSTSGTVRLQDREITKQKGSEIVMLRRGMGIVPQDFALLPKKKVWENLAYAMRAVGHSRRAVRRRVPEILDQVSIAHRADAFPHELSGGEQQRVAIARALINNPPLLLADEPTGNLDPQHSWEIMELLSALNVKGTTVLVASHDMMVIHRMGKRMVTLDKGKIIEDFPATSVTWSGSSREELDNYSASVVPKVEIVPISLPRAEGPSMLEVPIDIPNENSWEEGSVEAGPGNKDTYSLHSGIPDPKGQGNDIVETDAASFGETDLDRKDGSPPPAHHIPISDTNHALPSEESPDPTLSPATSDLEAKAPAGDSERQGTGQNLGNETIQASSNVSDSISPETLTTNEANGLKADHSVLAIDSAQSETVGAPPPELLPRADGDQNA